MGNHINRVKEIDVATVEGNKTLAAGMEQQAVERCKAAIEKLGVLHTPVIGAAKGKQIVLSGQCELIALRELGIKKMDAVEMDISGDGGETAKLALMLMSLRDVPGALCEGQLLQEAVEAGVSRTEIQTMLGKSASWVSNRISLVTRLDSSVYELVRSGLLDARSAQEVARLPADAQFAFADIAVREGLPKSAIESLVAGYNDEGCPDTVKAQILSDPKAALNRVSDRRRSIDDGQAGFHRKSAPPEDIDGCIKATLLHMSVLCNMLFDKSPFDINRHSKTLKEFESELSAMLIIIRKLVYPGKMEVEQDAV